MHHLWGGRAAPAGLRPRAAGRLRRPARRGVRGGAGGRGRPARRRVGRGDRRAGGAGRRRDALPPSGVPAGAARGDPGARGAADLRRDRHRVRSDRADVRRRARRGDPGRALRRQGAHRWLPDPGGGAVHAGGGPGHLRRRGAGARPDVHGQPAGCAVANASLGLLRAGDWAAEVARVGRGPAGRSGAAAGRAGGGATCGCWARSVWSSWTTRWTWRRRPPPRWPQGVWLRPFRDLVYTMPPYVTGDADVARIAAGIAAAVAAG